MSVITVNINFVVDNVSDLATVPSPNNFVLVKDLKRGGLFKYESTGFATDNGVVFEATEIGLGHWVRQFTGSVCVDWFGAVGDGVINDTTAISNAFTHAKTTGLSLFFPVGTYICDQILIDGLNNIRIFGNKNAVIKKPTGQSTLFTFTNSSELIFDNITFKSDATAAGAFQGEDLIKIHTGCSFITFENCVFTDYDKIAILAVEMAGGTLTKGLIVNNCRFVDAPNYNNGIQVGIFLGDDGEYSNISNNHFFNIPYAIRISGGANSIISKNIIMGLTGGDGTLNINTAAIYCDVGDNTGKVTITENKINHNENGLIAMILKGDPTKSQNPYNVIDNDFLINGNENVSYQLLMYNAPRSIISGNKFRAKTNANPCVRLNNCSNAIISNNYFHFGEYSLTVNASTGVSYLNNIAVSPSVGEIDVKVNSTCYYVNKNEYGFFDGATKDAAIWNKGFSYDKNYSSLNTNNPRWLVDKEFVENYAVTLSQVEGMVTGATGSYTTSDSKTVTVTNGLITSIV